MQKNIIEVDELLIKAAFFAANADYDKTYELLTQYLDILPPAKPNWVMLKKYENYLTFKNDFTKWRRYWPIDSMTYDSITHEYVECFEKLKKICGKESLETKNR